MAEKSLTSRYPREGGFLLSQIYLVSGRIFSRMMRDAGLKSFTPEQGRILFALWKKDGLPIVEIARQTSLKKSSLTAALDRLEKSGHVVREHSTTDRRQVLIHLTRKDKSLQKVYQRLSKEMADLSYKGFTDEEIVSLEQAMRKILGNLKEYEGPESASGRENG